MQKRSSNIFVLVGIDEDLLEVYERIFVESQKKKGVHPRIYDASEVSLNNALSESSQGILFGGLEFIWYRNLKNLNEQEFEKLVQALKENASRNIFISALETPSNLGRWKKLESALGLKLKLLDKSGNEAYLKHLVSLAKKDGVEITSRAALRLFEMCNGNFAQAYRELEKLVLYKLTERRINEQDVRDYVSRATEIRAFDFINSVLERDPARALEEYLNIRSSGEKPEAIFYLLLQQFSLFVAVATDFKAGQKPAEIVKERGIREWQVKKLIEQGRKWKLEEIATIYWKLLKLDSRIKKGLIKSFDLALKQFLLDLLWLQPAS
jgi:DNA polymerase-3 subunit delta